LMVSIVNNQSIPMRAIWFHRRRICDVLVMMPYALFDVDRAGIGRTKDYEARDHG